MLLTDAARAALVPAERAPPLPIPPRIPSNGEFTPPAQSPALRRYEQTMRDACERRAGALSVGEAAYARSPLAMAQAFATLNASFGAAHFDVGESEADDPDEAQRRRTALGQQFVFDDQVHFVRDDADPVLFEPLTRLIELSADLLRLPRSRTFAIEQIKFLHFLQAIYLDSDTKLALLSGAPSQTDAGWMLTNDMMAAARRAVNEVAGSRRLLTHAVITPAHDGWLEEMDRVHEEIRPDGWKGYPVGEPFSPSEKRYRLDDEALMYPAYERIVAAGVTNICIHKGLLPENADEVMPGAEPFARVDDVGKAARDWPQLDFVIYHAGYRTIPQPTLAELERFEATGRIDWVSDLAAIPERYGVSNVYADIGASFAFTVLTHPRLAAAMIGMLIKGLGEDKVCWGTDSVWYGSPQWQIEAFRRLAMPEDFQERFGYPDLGDRDSVVRRRILGENAARIHRIDTRDYREDALEAGDLPRIQAAYRALGGGPDGRAYGFTRPDA